MLANFTRIILQPARNLNPKLFLRYFFIIFTFLQCKRLFHGKSYFFCHCHLYSILYTFLVPETATKQEIDSIYLKNMYLLLTPGLLKYFMTIPHEKIYLKD